MLKIGRRHRLKVIRAVDFGVYLDSEAGDILLPRKYVPQGTEVGDILEVFIYKDPENRLIATTLVPKASVGEFAYLKVKEITNVGAFLDWGLEKDLLVPYKEQQQKMAAGRRYIVRIFLDERTDRITGSTKIDRFIERNEIRLREGDAVDLLVYQFTDIGIKVIINDCYFGMLYKNEVFQELHIGDRVKGFVKRIREDKKIDVMLKKGGIEDIEEAKRVILEKLEAGKRFLPLTDNSPPEEIRAALQMSKKTFKKAIGGLYKEGFIDLREDGIKLKRPDKAKILHKFKF
ncbi:MAG: S1-like domain-containing RNA-binding protein [Nitrospirota bacterium]